MNEDRHICLVYSPRSTFLFCSMASYLIVRTIFALKISIQNMQNSFFTRKYWKVFNRFIWYFLSYKMKKNINTYSIYFSWTLWEQGKLLVVSYHVPQTAKSIRKSRSKQCSKYDLLNVLNAYMTACVQVHTTLNIDCARFLSMHIQLYYPVYKYISIILY